MGWPRSRRRDETLHQPGSCPEADEAALVEAAQADPRAFAPLYARYLDPVYRYCFRRLGSREDAEEATSQVFLKALAALPGYREGSFRGWLFTIAHNVVTDHFRHCRSDRPLEAADDPPDAAQTPEGLALAAEERRTLHAALVQLPPDQRRVVELRLAGLSGAEIAAALGRSAGSVKMLQFRAVTRLRTLLDADVRPEEAHHEQD